LFLQNFQWHYQAEVMKIVILAGENEVNGGCNQDELQLL
jgi:hypothetical protein